MLINELAHIGLSKEEARVYIAALELGETTVARIADKSGLKRTTIYGYIEELKKKGLVELSVRRARTYISAKNPQQLKILNDDRARLIEEIVPKLRAVMSAIDKVPVVRRFEGREGIEQIYRETLEYSGQELLTWLSERDLEHTNTPFWTKFYIPERLRRKISTRAIVESGEESNKYKRAEKESLRQVRVDREGGVAIRAIILLYGGNRVAIISYDEMVGTVIESKNFFDTQKSLFEMHWGILGETGLR
ncbi:MAG: helix-turn-helix domain-containing protein [Candidatus Paceibacterota bacterium]|jgi:sugar-specific transcriptional regulator TrmB